MSDTTPFIRGAKIRGPRFEHFERALTSEIAEVFGGSPDSATKLQARALAKNNRHKPWARRWLRQNGGFY